MHANAKLSQRPDDPRCRAVCATIPTQRGAFSIIELLVVVGIIAVLISILLPTVARAREQANSVKCLANLRTLHQAATMHALDHQGFMPAAGEFTQTSLGVDSTPRGLGDPQMKRYTYFLDSEAPRLAPLPVALAPYMGLRPRFYDPPGITQFTARDDVRRLFLCPGQDPGSVPPGTTIVDSGGAVALPVYMSYVFNGAFLGRSINPYGTAPAGQVSRVRHPAGVFLFADGRPWGLPYFGYYAVMDGYSPHETFLDHVWVRQAGEQLDFARHRGRMNAVFLDGHADSFRLPAPTPVGATQNPGELDQLGISNGIYD